MGLGASRTLFRTNNSGQRHPHISVLPESGSFESENIAPIHKIFRKSITDDYTFNSKVVGTGFSGPVRLATHNTTGKVCAVKRYDKRAADRQRIEFLKSEAEVYLRVDHPNICKLFAIYEDEDHVWIVMEYCSGMELSHRLHQKKLYSEADAAHVAYQMAEAINYLHCRHIVHRDLKLENWLYDTLDSANDGRLKLIDFGFSKLWHPQRSKLMEASCGSLTYISPDTLRGSYTNACDMWSFGVTVHFLLVGIPPFFGSTERIVLERILRGAYSMTGLRWKAVSEMGKDFVRRLLVVDPEKRMTSAEALQHPWLARVAEEERYPLPPGVLPSLRAFAVASQLKRAALTMIAYSLTTKDIDDLANMFQQFDRRKDGCISLTDFLEVMKENFNISNVEIENLFNSMHSVRWDDDASYATVRYSDFIAAVLQTRLRFHEDTIREVFVKFDADRSGFITVEDLRRVIGDTIEGVDVDEVVRSVDTAGDGRIDYDAFLGIILQEAENEDEQLLKTSRTAPKSLPSAELGPKLGVPPDFRDSVTGYPQGLECTSSEHLISKLHDRAAKPDKSVASEQQEESHREAEISEKQDSDDQQIKPPLLRRRLLDLVERNLATREVYQFGGSPKIMTAMGTTHSSILSQIFGIYSYDPHSRHARAWDARIPMPEKYFIPAHVTLAPYFSQPPLIPGMAVAAPLSETIKNNQSGNSAAHPVSTKGAKTTVRQEHDHRVEEGAMDKLGLDVCNSDRGLKLCHQPPLLFVARSNEALARIALENEDDFFEALWMVEPDAVLLRHAAGDNDEEEPTKESLRTRNATRGSTNSFLNLPLFWQRESKSHPVHNINSTYSAAPKRVEERRFSAPGGSIRLRRQRRRSMLSEASKGSEDDRLR